MSVDPWCINPFITFAISSDGKYRLCCQSREIEQYNINNLPVEEFFSSEFMNDIRDSMLTKTKNDTIEHLCHGCIKEDEKGVVSKRVKDNRLHKNKVKTIKSVESYINSQNNYDILNIRFLDINMLGNLCNFKCIMCWYKASSRISSENILNDSNHTEKNSLILPYNTEQSKKKFFNTIYDIFENVDKINFYGGEPLIHPDFEEILDNLSKSNRAKNIQVYVITNGSKIPNYLYHKIKKFANFKLLISIDGVRDKAEYIRYGTKWSILENNIKNLLENNVDLTFNIAIQLLNVGYIDEIYKFLIKEYNIKNENIYNCYVNLPNYFDAIHLPNDLKDVYLNKLIKDSNYKLYADKVISLLTNKNRNEEIFKTGIEKLKYYDKIRKNCLLDSFPEFEKYY